MGSITAPLERSHDKLFSPLKIADGKIELKHRVVLAPLTRNRCLPLQEDDPETGTYNRVWVPDELVAEYYSQRTTDGGLLISEGIAPSLESNGMSGVPGLFLAEHLEGWKGVTKAVHAKGGYIYAQLWHAGRTTSEPFTGKPAVSPSVVPMEGDSYRVPAGHSGPVQYADFPPIELTKEHIKSTIQDYCNAAKMAMEAGFDGVEVHGGNGYLPEQFLSSNINKRTDEYGGSPQKRCRFVIELMEELAAAVGEENCAIRLSPFGLFNQARGEQRIETWSFLCEQLKAKIPKMSYISLIEPVRIHCFIDHFNIIVLMIRSAAIRANPFLLRERQISQLPGPRPVHHQPEVSAQDHERHALLLGRRLERHELLGCHRVGRIRRSPLRSLLYQHS